jgi:hypothetical protein
MKPDSEKIAHIIGTALQGESQQELDHNASDDRYLAEQGYVLLRQGERFSTST